MSKIAFSTMFPDVAPPPLLREKLGGALLSGADISKDLSVLKLQMETRTELSGDDLRELGREIGGVYGFADVQIRAEYRPPEPERPAEHYAPQGAAEKKRDGAVKDVLYGDKKLT